MTELRTRLLGARVRDVSGIADLDLVFYFDTSTEVNECVLVSFRPGLSRIHASTRAGMRDAPPPANSTKLLASKIRGAVVTDISAIENDRAAVFFLATPESKYQLRFELFTKQPGWYLVHENGKIEALRAEIETRRRILKIGADDAPPPPPPVHEIVASRFPRPDSSADSSFVTNRAVEDYYDPLARAALLDEFRVVLQKRIRTRRQNRENRIRGLNAQILEAASAPELRRRGELLSSARHQIARGASEARVVDYYDPALPTVMIPLDPGADLSLQIEKLFSRAKKMQDGVAHARVEIERAEREIAALGAAETALATVTEISDILKIEGGLEAKRILDKAKTSQITTKKGRVSIKKDKASQRKTRAAAIADCYRSFISKDGLQILVGRGAKDNDLLTFQVANGNDLWLHVGGGFPGSHVVVRLGNAESAPLETLLDAAALAVHFSKRRGAGRAEVIYTFAKFVTKPRRGHAGMAAVSGEKRIQVDLDSIRLGRLLTAHRSRVE
ncbi:MAG: NFACT RNA binding domain-containing protein [Planctomycetota bacterium]